MVRAVSNSQKFGISQEISEKNGKDGGRGYWGTEAMITSSLSLFMALEKIESSQVHCSSAYYNMLM